MISVNHLMLLIERYAQASGLSPHSVGRYAGGSGDFYGRLQRGHDITTRRAAHITQWLSDRWPDDLEWPVGIERPTPRRDAA